MRLRCLVSCAASSWMLAVNPTARADVPPYAFGTLAGTTSHGSTDGPGSQARFWGPTGVALDAQGNLYVADSGNHVIRKITSAGVVSTCAGKAGQVGSADGPGAEARFHFPSHLAVDATGNVFVSDMFNHAIRRITPVGTVSTWAGQTGVAGTADGPGTAARFYRPAGIALDDAGTLYVTDMANHTVRKISPAGVVSTIAGVAGAPGYADGSGTDARFFNPYDLTVDRTGNVYITEVGGDTLRRIAPNGAVTTLGGNAPGGWTNIFFQVPTGVAADAAGTVYLSDDNHTVRRVTVQGVHDTIAGNAVDPGSADGTGVAARFRFPEGLAIEPTGNVFVADRGNNAVRRITPGGTVTTVAGLGPEGARAHADGQGQAARFHTLSGITRGPGGELYVADPMNNSIRSVSPDGSVTTLPVSLALPTPPSGGNTSDLLPVTLAADRSGNLFYADSYHATVNKITPDGNVSVLYRGQKPECWIEAIAVDRAGNVYFAEMRSMWDSDVRKIAPDGSLSIFARQPDFLQVGPSNPLGRVLTALTVDADDNVYLAYSANVTVRGLSPASKPWLAKIVKITPAGVCTLLAGGNNDTYSDGPATSAGFSLITGLAWDDAGRLFIADHFNGTVRMLGADGIVSTLAGRTDSYFSIDGVGRAAQFADLQGIAVGADGRVFVTDSSELREGLPAGPPVIVTQPQSLSVTVGGAVQFSVTASGVPEPTYQWFFNDIPFTGATASTLAFNNARASDAGEYSVTVTNSLGSVTSAMATLTVSPAPSPPPSPPPPSPAAGGGGGGAPSLWFMGLLTVIVCARRLTVRS